MIQNRNKWMDIAKGITIVLMVLGHSSIPQSLSNFIWSFHMPLFFIASGWMTNWGKYSFFEFTNKRVRTLLIPFFVYSTIVLMMLNEMNGGQIWGRIKLGWGGFALWFIPVLFVSSLIGRWVYMVGNKYIRLCLMLMLLLMGCVSSNYHFLWPWAQCSIPFACFLVILGREMKKWNVWIDPPHWWIVCGGFIASYLISQFWKLNMCTNEILPIMPLTVAAISGTLAMFTLSSYLSKKAKIIYSA